jgi:hypothetical protein
MSRATVVYIVMLVACVAGLWAILGLGGRLRAPTDLSGVWTVGGEDPSVPKQLGESVIIEQSGRFVRLNFANGLVVDAKMMTDQPPVPEAGKNLDIVFEGPDWKLIAFGSSADGPLIFRLVGRERHTFTATRHADVPDVPEAPDAADVQASGDAGPATADARPRTPAPPAVTVTAAAAADELPAAETTADVGTDAP